VYDPETSILHFVDIDERKVTSCWRSLDEADGHKILHYNTVSLEVQVEQFDEKVGCVALRRDGRGVQLRCFLVRILTAL
jgi:hypothetical protein